MLKEELLGQDQYHAAGILVFAKDTEKFLFVQRSNLVNSPLVWSVPGGHAEIKETPWQAAHREFQEETGEDLAHAAHETIWSQKSQFPRTAYALFAAIVDEQFAPKLNWESAGYIWCHLDEIPEPRHGGINALLSNNKAGEKLKDFISKHHSGMIFND